MLPEIANRLGSKSRHLQHIQQAVGDLLEQGIMLADASSLQVFADLLGASGSNAIEGCQSLGLIGEGRDVLRHVLEDAGDSSMCVDLEDVGPEEFQHRAH